MKSSHQFFAELVSEFSGFHRTPQFKASRSTGNLESGNSGKSSRRASTESTTSNHSIHISVGVDKVPILNPRRRQRHLNLPHFVKNFSSSPSISRMASLSSVQEKLQRKLKKSESLGSLEFSDFENSRNSRKTSTASYRVIP